MVSFQKEKDVHTSFLPRESIYLISHFEETYLQNCVLFEGMNKNKINLFTVIDFY